MTPPFPNPNPNPNLNPNPSPTPTPTSFAAPPGPAPKRPRHPLYNRIRRLHLFTALVMVVFVLMYFVSGYLMIHGPWFPSLAPQKSTRHVALQYSGAPNTPAFTEYLAQTFDVRGKPQEPRHQADGSWKFTYIRPGMNYEVVVAASGKAATITQSRFGVVGIFHGLHRLHGYGGGWLYWLWSLLYDLASASLIFFALTGIWLWYQRAVQRLAGWLCLGASFGFAGAMILYLMFSR